MFPALPETAVFPSRRALRWLLTVLAVAAAAVVMLLRISGRSPLDTIYAEDGAIFLVEALAAPGHLFISYAGYLELWPRIVGQVAAIVPLRDASVVFGLSGAVTAAAVAVFAYYASAAHVRSPWLRVLIGLSVILLPIAPMEIADSGVNSPWYLLYALFWATLWRPRSTSGRALAAFVGFITTASTPLAALLFPILVLRLIALRKLREHWVTIACAVGIVLQVIIAHTSHHSRFKKHENPLGSVLAFYAHEVVLRSVGWHVSWGLQDSLGLNVATAVVGIVLVVVFGWILVSGSRRVRLFTVVALVTGFISTVVPATLQTGVTLRAATPAAESASRYTIVALFTLAAAAIVAVDALCRRTETAAAAATLPEESAAADSTLLPGEGSVAVNGAPPRTERAHRGAHRAERGALTWTGVVAAAVLVVVLALSWIPDFRWLRGRGEATPWGPLASQMLTSCQHSATGSIPAPAWTHDMAREQIIIPCANLHP